MGCFTSLSPSFRIAEDILVKFKRCDLSYDKRSLKNGGRHGGGDREQRNLLDGRNASWFS